MKERNLMEAPVTVLCFSKDRPFQLKEYLRSLRIAADQKIKIHVLYKDTGRFTASYEQVEKMFPDVVFVKETLFYQNVLDVISQAGDYIQFDVDDTLYYRKTDYASAFSALKQNDLLNFQWCMFPGCTTSQTAGGRTATLPSFSDHDRYLSWDRKTGTLSWGWPFKLTSSVYRTTDILPAVKMAGPKVVRGPNAFEAGIVQYMRMGGMFQHLPKSACLKQSICSVLAVNLVQNVAPSPICGDGIQLGTDQLDLLLKEGRELDLEYYQSKTFTSSHIGDFVLKESTP
jgi:hypothetical protein